MDELHEKDSLGGLERMRLEMVVARHAYCESSRRFAIRPLESLTAEEMSDHQALGTRDANATAIYVQCLLAVSDRARETGSYLSRAAPLS